MRTSRGIYYNLDESTYKFKIGDLTFKFSSKFYLNKFVSRFSDYRMNETLKLCSKYNCKIYCDNMILLNLYKKIEKRGFKVYYKDIELNENYYIETMININS